jgi:predicted nicotinamide N-methyase
VHADDEVLPLPECRRFDLLIGSDLPYERDFSGTLTGLIERHAKPQAEVWIFDTGRNKRSASNRLVRGQGFDLTETRLHQPAAVHPPAYEGRLLVYKRSGA